MRLNSVTRSVCALAAALTLSCHVGALAAPTVAGGASSAPAAPLLQEGKSSIYRRVLTTPSCTLYANASFSKKLEKPAAFSLFYVFEETPLYVRVGPDPDPANISGYLQKSCTVEWKQQVALMFTNHADRSRALIYKDEAALDRRIESEDPAKLHDSELARVEKGQPVDDVISVEPDKYVDYRENFYLLPVLNSVESMFSDGSYTYKHEIASVISNEAQSSTQSVTGSENATGIDASDITGFKSALVFVIDSSISMQPYIDAVRDVIRGVYKRLEAEDLADSVQFGIISFRGDSRKVKGLQYTTKTFLKPGDALNVEAFNMAVGDLSQATVSSAQFNEDAFAGVSRALDSIDWNAYGGRYIVLVTDAGAIDAGDPESSTGFDAEALRLEAAHYGTAVYAFHLKTEAGVKTGNFEKAKAQYERLSFNSVLNKPLYYPVNADSIPEVKAMVDSLSQGITEQVKSASLGEMAAGSALSSEQGARPGANGSSLDDDTKKIGYAMQLAYLGSVQGTKAPEFMTGWMSDRDMKNHNRLVCTPVVMVNALQLNDLYVLVKGVLEAGIAGQLSSDSMFEQLQSLAAQMGRDPSMLSREKSLDDMGITGELLDGLPYKSRIASLTPDDWYAMGSQEQESVIRALENSLRHMEHCIEDRSRWVLLNENADLNEQVYPVPLDALP